MRGQPTNLEVGLVRCEHDKYFTPKMGSKNEACAFMPQWNRSLCFSKSVVAATDVYKYSSGVDTVLVRSIMAKGGQQYLPLNMADEEIYFYLQAPKNCSMH